MSFYFELILKRDFFMHKSKGIKSYKQHTINENYDAIIIGSGVSGLTSGAILAKDGQKVLILEQHYTAGGYSHVFTRKGYEWDVGIHYVGGVNHAQSVLSILSTYITDGQLEWEDLGEVYDRIFFGDDKFEFHKGRKQFLENLKAKFTDPSDHRAIDLYMDLVRQANKASRNYFAEKALPPELAEQMGPFMREPFLKFARQTTREVLEELTDNMRLIGVLTAQFGDYGLTPGASSFAMHAMLVSHYMYGAGFPVGGSSRIADTVADVLAEHGGLILVNADVDEVLVKNGQAVGVKMADGQEHHAPLVISCAGIYNTYTHLLSDEVKATYQLPTFVQKTAPSKAHIALYVGFEETAAELGLQKANYWIYPDNQYDHDANLAAYLENPDDGFAGVFVGFASAKDPDWESRYPGRATIDIITLVPYEWFADWEGTKWMKRGEDYETFKENLSQRLLDVLYRYEPQVKGKVAHYELSTPLSTKNFTNYQFGEIYGIEHTPERFEQEFLRPHTPIENLYLTGQDIVTAGIAGALMSGALTVSAIYKRDITSEIYEAVTKQSS